MYIKAKLRKVYKSISVVHYNLVIYI